MNDALLVFEQGIVSIDGGAGGIMFYRIKQFVTGVMAHGPNSEEKARIEKILSPKAKELFYAMNRADQRHSLRVMYTAEKLWADSANWLDSEEFSLLLRCCLLHDIGRGSRMGPVRKSWAVILDKLQPIWSRRHGRCDSKSYIRGLLYRYYHHGKISGEMLSAIGMSQEARIVSRHHKKSSVGLTEKEAFVLNILRQADSLN